MEEERILDPNESDADIEENDNPLRPQTLEEYVGQEKVKENLKVFIEAAKNQKRAFRPCATIRSSRPRKNNTLHDNCKRTWSKHKSNFGSGN